MLLSMLVGNLMAMVVQQKGPVQITHCAVESAVRQIARMMRLVLKPLRRPHPAALGIFGCNGHFVVLDRQGPESLLRGLDLRLQSSSLRLCPAGQIKQMQHCMAWASPASLLSCTCVADVIAFLVLPSLRAHTC